MSVQGNEAKSGAASPVFTCLAVDDDAAFLSMLERVIREEGGEPTLCGNIAAARRRLEEHSYNLILLDNGLPDGTGFDFYSEVDRRSPGSVVMMITGAPELANAVALTRNGLFEYLTKPLSLDDFAAALRRAKARLRQPEPAGELAMIGDSPAVRETIHTLRQAARHRTAPVLILGETGTGKDLAARLLHQWTYAERRPLPPYIPVNCAAVPAEMFEAELFGSEKGAYTGADRRRGGLIEAAEGGTLFLDEVAEIPLPLQAKLLRFLESREYRALGATQTKTFTGRLVAATHRNLAEEVRLGRFREDLMFRLDVMNVPVPPLRDRLGDLPALAENLLAQLAAKYERACPLLRPEDLAALKGYSFPGNIRELRNILERSLLKCPEEARWLSLDLSWLKGLPAAGSTVARTPFAPPASSGSSSPSSSSSPVPTPIPGGGGSVGAAVPAIPPRDLSAIELQEYQLIQRTLQEERGAIRRAASRLGLTHQALLRRLQKWPELRQINPPDSP